MALHNLPSRTEAPSTFPKHLKRTHETNKDEATVNKEETIREADHIFITVTI